MKLGRILVLLMLLLTLIPACAEVYRLPASLAVVESEAFSGVPVGNSLFVPETCLYLAPDAFGETEMTVYGFRSSAGSSFAEANAFPFVDVGIYDISYTCKGRMFTLLPVDISVSFDSPVPASVTDIRLLSGETVIPVTEGENTFTVPGTFDLSVTVKNEWVEKTAVFEDAVTLGDTVSINEQVERLQFIPNWYYLEPEQSERIELTVFGDGEPVLLWENTEPETVVLSEDGVVTALNPGGAKIRVRLAGREEVKAELSVNVLSDNRELVMPARTTDESGIAANLSRIYSVENSALTELRSHYANGDIDENILKARTGIISRAFSSYTFPWMVEEPLPYWKEENSDDGTKNFVPGTVYYGLPYISGEFMNNRTYNAAKAVAEGKFIKDGDKYLFNPEGLMSNNYAGCDCSSFVGGCFYRIDRVKDIRTQTLGWSGDFITLAAGEELIPGDIIVSGYHHVVMFLYYADEAHTQVVIIEQGGDEYGTATVNVNTRSLSYYTGSGYICRRYKNWKYYDYAAADGTNFNAQ